MFAPSALLALATARPLPAATALPDGSPRRIGGWSQTHTFTPADRPSILNCTWQNFTQKVDHFGDNPGTFPQRVCLYSKWWKSPSNNTFNAPDGAPGPILFYTGNESPVDEYVNNTGLMWELGEQLGALLVFAEHRYEPLSHPALCGLGSQRCFAYCTTAQAIADWVTIIASLRKQHAVRAPVVAFGGSYGGMLAGWFRMKYPDVVDGVIAASAPIWQLAGTVRRETLDMQAVAITRGVSAAGGATDQCRDNLRAAWPLIQQVGRTRRGRQLLSAHVGACHEIGNADELYEHPRHPYTRALLASIPEPAPTVDVSEGDIEGELPSPIHPPAGCRFNTRCQHATDICFTDEPVMQQVGDSDHYLACHHPVEVAVSVV